MIESTALLRGASVFRLSTVVGLRGLRRAVAAVLLVVVAGASASGQAFISPMYGLNFGGASGCPQLSNCRDSQTNVSAGAGALWPGIAAEVEVAYAPKFLGKAAGLSATATSLTGNVMLAPQVGPLRPYMLGGIGAVRTRIDLASSELGASSDTNLIFSVGGGLMWFVTNRVGVRADMRYFHSFSDHSVMGLTLNSSNIDYSRVSSGVVVRF